MPVVNGKYQIGICMAGAISAGAYTAGVIDYLLEALEKWEYAKKKARETSDDSIPMHDVEIPAFTGASAGGITAILTAVALHEEIPHFGSSTLNINDIKRINKLYNTWVNITETNEEDMFDQLLNTSDLEGGKIRSVLNSDFISRLAKQSIQKFNKPGIARNYISPDLEVLVTLSNLNGIEYDSIFTSDSEKGKQYNIVRHSDFGHFRLASSYKNDGKIEIDFTQDKNLTIMQQCAMATGAFPIGLRYREVVRPPKYINENKFINLTSSTCPPKRDIVPPDKDYHTVNIDGGMINNEPFRMTVKMLREKLNLEDDKKLENAAILMIDPFPSTSGEAKNKNFDPGIFGIIGKIVGAMRNQMLYESNKKNHYPGAYSLLDESDRFMIIPTRHDGTVRIEGDEAIACGSLYGFGGFMHKSFRDHDFFLGRRNCQLFLQKWFVVPDNPSSSLIINGYSPEARKKYAIERLIDNKMVTLFPIIPVIDPKVVPNPHLEKIDFEEHIASKKNQLNNRVRKLTSSATPSWFINMLLRTLVFFGKGTISQGVLDVIRKDLGKRKLIK